MCEPDKDVKLPTTGYTAGRDRLVIIPEEHTMSAARVGWLTLVGLAVVIGCAKKPPESPDTPSVPDVVIAPPPPDDGARGADLSGLELAPMPRLQLLASIKWVPGTNEEQAAFISHIPEPIRKLYGTAFQCFTDLEGKAVAWEYSGGPVRLWMEFEEQGQSTVPKRYPEREDWLVKGQTGRVIFWIRRGVSEKINTVLKRAGKPEGDTSAVGLGVIITSSAGGRNDSVGYTNPLWYGWGGYSFSREQPTDEVLLRGYEPTPFYVLEAAESKAAGVEEARRAKLTLKIQRVRPE